MARKMNAKFEKHWGKVNLLMGVAAVLDPRYKMTLIRFCYPIIYRDGPIGNAETKIDHLSEIMKELYNDYILEYNSSVMEQNSQCNAQESSSSIGSVTTANVQSGVDLYDSFVRSAETLQQPIKTELQVYLEENVLICEKGVEFSALGWWKANALKYRILSILAKDVLSTPITTVSSESTFSAGGRIIDAYRASLTPETVQMLVCGADWVRA
jgi:hypothetical protein